MEKYKAGYEYKEFHQKNEISLMKFEDNCAQIFILQKNPPAEIINDVKNFEPFFQIYAKNNIIFLLIKFGDSDWIDIPYIFENAKIQKIEDEISGYRCCIHFADIVTGKLLVQKYSCFSNGLSKALYFAIEKQEKHLPKNIIEKINTLRASFHPNEIARLSLGR